MLIFLYNIGMIIWLIVALFFILLGISAFFKKDTFNFWANFKGAEIRDVKAYNRSVGRLFLLYGFLLALLALLLKEGEPLKVVFAILGVIVLTILLMVIYQSLIVPKYRK